MARNASSCSGSRHVVAQAQADHLRRIGDRAAADGQQRIGAAPRAPHSPPRPRRCAAYARRSSRTRRPACCRARRARWSITSVCRAKRAAGQHIDRAGADPFDLLRQRLGERRAVDHPLHRRVAMDAADCMAAQPLRLAERVERGDFLALAVVSPRRCARRAAPHLHRTAAPPGPRRRIAAISSISATQRYALEYMLGHLPGQPAEQRRLAGGKFRLQRLGRAGARSPPASSPRRAR